MLVGKINFVCKLIIVLTKAFIIPLIISVLLFYLIRPLNDIFIKKGISRGKASILSLTICTFILSGLLSHFAKYAYKQFYDILKQLMAIINNRDQIDGVINWVNQFININEIYSLLVGMVKVYVSKIGRSFKIILGYFMNTFSTVFLIIVIIFYMLKDGNKFKDKILFFIPEKHKNTADKILCESDEILSHYVTGQAKVALSLSLMILLGYKIIGMPDALLLSTITFILAFIPFVGFFISMIIPGVIALSMGLSITLKFIAMFIIVQTLKGRVIVPAIMSKCMKMHPLTDIFLVIGAIGIGGPFAAFAVVPIYAILKNICLILGILNKR
jgi:predicted PurR-regulated permease PerM